MSLVEGKLLLIWYKLHETLLKCKLQTTFLLETNNSRAILNSIELES